MQIIQGRIVKRRGLRHFAVAKNLSLTDRIANHTQCRGNWDRVVSHNATARLVRNYR